MPPILMVHGAFCGGWVFDRFRAPFEAAGCTVSAPDLPGHGRGATSDAVAGLSMRDYAAAVAQACRASPEPPVLVGHSLGGLVCQMAAVQAPVRALALLAPSAPWGVSVSTVEEAMGAAGLPFVGGPFWSQPVSPDPELVRNFSLNRLPTAQREATLQRFTPESGRALWEAFNWWLDPFMTTSLAAASSLPPTLVIVGEKDVIHSPETVRQTAARLKGEFRIAPGMSHWLPAEPGWRDVADWVLEWLDRDVRAAA